MDQTVLLENESELLTENQTGRAVEGGSITPVVSLPSENVSTVPEEGMYPLWRAGGTPEVSNYHHVSFGCTII